MTANNDTTDPYAEGSPILVSFPSGWRGYGHERRTVVKRTKTQFTDDKGETWLSRTGRLKGSTHDAWGRNTSVSPWFDGTEAKIAAYAEEMRAGKVHRAVDAVTVRALKALNDSNTDAATLEALNDMISKLERIRHDLTAEALA